MTSCSLHKPLTYCFTLLALAASLVSCGGRVSPSFQPSESVTTPTTLPATAEPSLTETAPPTGEVSAEILPEATNTVFPTPYINPDTLRFVFSTPMPPPKSAWRPPLYDVPWALTPHDHFYFARPIAADEINWPLADYRYGGIFPGTTDVVHTGIDIDAPAGTPVMAAADGKVIWAGYGLSHGPKSTDDPYGNAVAIRHTFGFNGKRLETVYAHMQQVNVVEGQVVTMGQNIGLVGDTGLTTGPHLHFEIRVEEYNYFTTRNPELWLAPPQGWGVLVGRLLNDIDEPLYNQEVSVKALNSNNIWQVRTYGPKLVKSDSYYKENMVLSDLPAGEYKVWFNFGGMTYERNIMIYPGAVSLFEFHGKDGFTAIPTPTPGLDFLKTPVPKP
jgi:murein DD-endopeptidase MepM/ murein hydrolase activator NlpD